MLSAGEHLRRTRGLWGRAWSTEGWRDGHEQQESGENEAIQPGVGAGVAGGSQQSHGEASRRDGERRWMVWSE